MRERRDHSTQLLQKPRCWGRRTWGTAFTSCLTAGETEAHGGNSAKWLHASPLPRPLPGWEARRDDTDLGLLLQSDQLTHVPEIYIYYVYSFPIWWNDFILFLRIFAILLPVQGFQKTKVESPLELLTFKNLKFFFKLDKIENTPKWLKEFETLWMLQCEEP